MTKERFKAVIPAAGLGTRFLPATKAMPKEMLPVVDKPAIQYVVEEAVAAGIHDILIVLGRNKEAISDHFDQVPELERRLSQKGEHRRLAEVVASSELADIHYVRQGEPKGLGHAVLRTRSHVGDSSFAVLLGDDLVDERDPLLAAMIAEHVRSGAAVIALMEVAPEQIHLYGTAALDGRPEGAAEDVRRVSGLVEKPAREDAPSNFAVIGRYILPASIFDVLEQILPGRGGEIQLTDALHRVAADPDGPGLHAVIFGGRRYDTGDRLEYLKAIVRLAVEREDLGPEVRTWLKGFAEEI